MGRKGAFSDVLVQRLQLPAITKCVRGCREVVWEVSTEQGQEGLGGMERPAECELLSSCPMSHRAQPTLASRQGTEHAVPVDPLPLGVEVWVL